MAELSNHSYHYKSDLITFTRRRQPRVDNRPSNKYENQSSDEDTGSKKKQRRKKRNLTGVSKQRRAANERERRRLNIINLAFKDLKSILPLYPGEENISKIEIVRLATKTIKYLSDILKSDITEDDISSTRLIKSPSESESNDEFVPSTTSSVSSQNDNLFDNLDDVFDINDACISSLLNAVCQGNTNLTSSSTGFDDLDISSIIDTNNENKVFPSMLYL